MAASVIYLDIDDEITSAAARIRAAEAVRIALVLPAGSHLATSRINFRLLAREAQGRSRQLLIVAPDAAARALAASAGLEVYASVRELEAEIGAVAADGHGAALEDGPVAGAVVPVVIPASATSPLDEMLPFDDESALGDESALDETQPVATVGPSASAASAASGSRQAAGRSPDRGPMARRRDAADLPVAARPRRGRQPTIAAVLAVVAALVLVGGVLAYVFLPAATIVVTPRIEAIGPLTFAVRADPAVTTADPVAGVVPATVATLPLEESASFPATGTKVSETRARGEVTFTNKNNAESVLIPAGTQVSTTSGVVFATTAAVNVPKATTHGVIIDPGTADAPVRAVEPGTAGNVPAGSITRVSSAIQAKLVNSDDPVNNSAPTSGGTHTETLVVAQKDIDRATVTLTQRLNSDLAAVLANPASVLPDVTAFPETKTLTRPVPTVDPATLLGKAMTTFTYGLTATGGVTTVDESAVRDIAEARLRAGVGSDHDLVRDSLRISVGKGSVLDEAIVFPVNASASRLRRLDPAQLRSQVRGRTIADARAALSPYGDVSIDTWPGFVSSIPTYDFRVDLTVNAPAPVESAGPSPSDGGAGAGAGSSGTGRDGGLPSGAGESASP
jgi:hypothetical protein